MGQSYTTTWIMRLPSLLVFNVKRLILQCAKQTLFPELASWWASTVSLNWLVCTSFRDYTRFPLFKSFFIYTWRCRLYSTDIGNYQKTFLIKSSSNCFTLFHSSCMVLRQTNVFHYEYGHIILYVQPLPKICLSKKTKTTTLQWLVILCWFRLLGVEAKSYSSPTRRPEQHRKKKKHKEKEKHKHKKKVGNFVYQLASIFLIISLTALSILVCWFC